MSKTENIADYLKKEEAKLSEFATRSSESKGRKKEIEEDPFRLEFARDDTRILHSMPFRRLKHKTQVFLSPDNDHICTRMEHVLHVSSIASIIGRCLKLNTDLIHAIAKAHDLGHPPFGHVGERKLNEILLKQNIDYGFKHEIHGLRVVDKLTNYGEGLNLTYEVRDGIISHCGEMFEQRVAPDREKDLTIIENINDRSGYPATLEGALVRVVDRIAYLGRDLEDGIKAGLVKKGDIPKDVAKWLGTDNGKIIGSFVNDVIAESWETDSINLSDGVFDLMNQLKKFNYKYIYLHPDVEKKGYKGKHVLGELYLRIEEVLEKSSRGRDQGYIDTVLSDIPSMQVFMDFIKNSNYSDETPSWRILVDYIAGMTDSFAQRSYLQFFLPTPIV